MSKQYATPHRSRVVKTRMTEKEYADFTERLAACDMSQSEFIRQAITGTTVRPLITVFPVNDELLAAVGKLTAEYGKIGGSLNQIARYLNEYHNPYYALVKKLAEKEGVTEKLKAEDGMKWTQTMNNIRNRAAEVVYNDLIFN